MIKDIIDVCCGSRMFWFNKKHPNAIYMDIRTHEPELLSNGSVLKVEPDVIGDFRDIPFEDSRFSLVIFDPPHTFCGKKSFLYKKYGTLTKEWRENLTKGFAECFRILAPAGTLIFKWNENNIRLSEILALTPEQPIISHKKDRTYFVVFHKSSSDFTGT